MIPRFPLGAHSQCRYVKTNLNPNPYPNPNPNPSPNPDQGLSRFASDIIIRGFDTPMKLGFYDGQFVAENLNSTPMPTPMPEPNPNPTPNLTQVNAWRRTSTTQAS